MKAPTLESDPPSPARVRKLRETTGVSQTAAANATYVSLRTWQNWESGKHAMNPIVWNWFKDWCHYHATRL